MRLNIISTLRVASTVIGVEQLSHSLLAITDLAQDRQWRGAWPSSIQFPAFPTPSRLLRREAEMCLGWLQDCVFAIREAIANVCRIEVFDG